MSVPARPGGRAASAKSPITDLIKEAIRRKVGEVGTAAAILDLQRFSRLRYSICATVIRRKRPLQHKIQAVVLAWTGARLVADFSEVDPLTPEKVRGLPALPPKV